MSLSRTSVLEKDLLERLRELSPGNARAMAATIVAISDADGASRIDALVDSLMGRRPARVIHARAHVTGGEDRSWSSARCSLDRQRRGVCFEDLYIETGNARAWDTRIWSDLVIRELPALVLAAAENFPTPEGARDFLNFADLMLVDPEGFGIPRADPLLLHKRIETLPLVDLTWERLLPVRMAVSRLFEGDDYVERLSLLKSVRIRGLKPWSASLTAAWLATRLGLRAPKASGSADGVPGSKGVIGSGSWIRLSGFSVNFEIDTSGTTVGVDFSFEDGSSMELVFPTEREAVLVRHPAPDMRLSFPKPDDGAILARLLDAPLVDPLYADALAALAQAVDGKVRRRPSWLGNNGTEDSCL